MLPFCQPLAAFHSAPAPEKPPVSRPRWVDREGTATATWEPTRRRAEKEGKKAGWEGAREAGGREEERGRREGGTEERREQRTEELGLARGAGKGLPIEGVRRHLGAGQGARWSNRPACSRPPRLRVGVEG